MLLSYSLVTRLEERREKGRKEKLIGKENEQINNAAVSKKEERNAPNWTDS